MVAAAGSTDAASSDEDAAGVEEEVEEVVEAVAPLHVDGNTTTMNLQMVTLLVDEGDINLNPRYQRKYIWKPVKAYRLVESVMASLHVPAVVLHTGVDDVDSVVDGKQRITTLHAFKKGQFPNGQEFRLEGLTLLPQLNNKMYAELPERGPFSRKTFDQFTLSVTRFKRETSEEAVLRVYEDLNCGSENLNKQQIRRMVYGGSFIDLLECLAKEPQLLQVRRAQGLCKAESDQELILRFFTLRHHQGNFKGTVAKKMDQYLAWRRQLEQEEEEDHRRLFCGTLEAVFQVYGRDAFHHWTGRGYDKNISTALWDSVMVAFADLDREQRQAAIRNSAALIDGLKQLCCHPDFATARFSAPRFISRLRLYQDLLRQVVGPYRSREFPDTEALRIRLYHAQGGKACTCALCGGVIQQWQDAHLDHRQPYSAGGASDEANAQLVHAACNLKKGTRSDAEFQRSLRS